MTVDVQKFGLSEDVLSDGLMVWCADVQVSEVHGCGEESEESQNSVDDQPSGAVIGWWCVGSGGERLHRQYLDPGQGSFQLCYLARLFPKERNVMFVHHLWCRCFAEYLHAGENGS